MYMEYSDAALNWEDCTAREEKQTWEGVWPV